MRFIEVICACVRKNTVATRTAKKGKCADCEELPSKEPKEGVLAADPSLDLSRRPN